MLARTCGKPVVARYRSTPENASGIGGITLLTPRRMAEFSISPETLVNGLFTRTDAKSHRTTRTVAVAVSPPTTSSRTWTRNRRSAVDVRRPSWRPPTPSRATGRTSRTTAISGLATAPETVGRARGRARAEGEAERWHPTNSAIWASTSDAYRRGSPRRGGG